MFGFRSFLILAVYFAITSSEITPFAEKPEEFFGVQEVVIESKKKKKCNSKFLKCLLLCLEEKRHPHMLWYTSISKTEFQVKMVHKKSALWSRNDISLFEDLDLLYERDKYKKKYAEDCKTRFKAKISKLHNCVEETGCKIVNTSVKIRTYKILYNNIENFDLGKKHLNAKSARSKKKAISCNTRGILVETGVQINKSHFPCLSPNTDLSENKNTIEGNGNNTFNHFSQSKNTSNTLIAKNPGDLSINLGDNTNFVLYFLNNPMEGNGDNTFNHLAQNRINAPNTLIAENLGALSNTMEGNGSNTFNHFAQSGNTSNTLFAKNTGDLSNTMEGNGSNTFNHFAQSGNTSNTLFVKNTGDLSNTMEGNGNNTFNQFAQSGNTPNTLIAKNPGDLTDCMYNVENNFEDFISPIPDYKKDDFLELNEDFSTYNVECSLKSGYNPCTTATISELSQNASMVNIGDKLDLESLFPGDYKNEDISVQKENNVYDLEMEWLTTFQMLNTDTK